ncbi:TonB family protein [Vicingaceae bacterium]|nr:TonB family protein [Vicingaceae bacterium]
MNHFTEKNKTLEKLRGIYFQIGLIVAGGLTLVAFEWTTPTNPYDLPETSVIYEEEWEMPPILPEKKIEKPEVQPEEYKKKSETFVIVEILPEPEPDPKPEPLPDPKFDPKEWQPDPEPTPEPETFLIVEKMPEFVGGNKARLMFLSDNIKYPSIDKAGGIEGTVYLDFVVNKKGEIRKVNILRGVSPTIDAEAVRVVKAMPNWTPGKQRGKAVSVKYNFRIKFKLS